MHIIKLVIEVLASGKEAEYNYVLILFGGLDLVL